MKTVLVIDDDPIVRRLLERSLEKAGYRFAHAETVAAGRALLATLDADLVVLDLYLPDGKGFELLHHLRHDLGRSTPVIVLSGLKQAESVLRAVDEGAMDYVVKPFSPREILTRISQALDAR